MTTRHALALAILALCLAPAASVPPPATTWQGLVGMFTEPTAQSYPGKTATLGYAEIRFGQENTVENLNNSWFTGSLTITPGRRWEVAGIVRHEIASFFPAPGLSGPTTDYDESLVTASAKYIIREAKPNKVGVAVGVMDIFGQTKDLGGLRTDRGTRSFLVGSYNWFHSGITYENSNIGAYFGATLSVNDNLAIIAEYSTKPLFVRLGPVVSNPNNFNIGVRFRPTDLPRMHIDLTAVGDGKFSFGFALGYELPLAGTP